MATKIKKIIDFYSEHKVSDNIRDSVLERISASKDDKEVDEVFRTLWDKADAAYMDADEISTAFDRMHLFDKDKPRSRILQMLSWQRVVAVIVPLVMLVIFGKIYMQTHNAQQNPPEIAMLQQHTINGECKTVAMADGTQVRLSQSSVLCYPSSFEGKERKVFLTGEAFFDIKHDAKRPFHVSSPYFEITDLGTSFMVSSYTTDEEVSATLKTGKIEIQIAGEGKKYCMKPNEQLVYNVRTKAVNIRKVASEEIGTSWRNKEIDLNDVTLAKAANILSKTYGVKFVFTSKRYQNTKITVHFNQGETLSSAMSIIKDLIPGMTYEIRKGIVIVK